MRNYDRINTRKPEGIEEKKAHIIGGGIAGLSAAAFLVRDAKMPGKNITIYDSLPVFGGSMDACGMLKPGISQEARENLSLIWNAYGIYSEASLPFMKKAEQFLMRQENAIRTMKSIQSIVYGKKVLFLLMKRHLA